MSITQPGVSPTGAAGRPPAARWWRGPWRAAGRPSASPLAADAKRTRPVDPRATGDCEAGAHRDPGAPDAGMSTVEYAVGTVVAAAFAAVLYKIVTGDSVVAGLTDLIQSALTSAF